MISQDDGGLGADSALRVDGAEAKDALGDHAGLQADPALQLAVDEPAFTLPAAGRSWLASPALQGVAALGIYLVVWVSLVTRRLLLHASQAQLLQKSPDPNFYVWSLRWWPYAVAHGLNPLYSHEIAAPAGHALAWITTTSPLALLTAPLTLTAGPVVSFNLLEAVALPVSGWAAFVLCRRLTGTFWPALVGGAVFGFSAYEMSHNGAGQINLTYSLLVPLLAYIMVVWWQGSISARTFVIVAALTIAVQFFLFLETFADLTAFLALALVLGLVLAGRQYRAEMLRLTRLSAAAYLIALVLVAPYLAYALTTTPPKPANITAMDLASLVVPQLGHTFGISWLASAAAGPRPVSAGCYVGIPLLVLVLVLVVTGWSSRIVRFLTVMLPIIVVASLGPVLYVERHRDGKLPWAPLFHLPLVRNSYPSRLMLFAFLALAVATALFLANPARRVAWLRWPLAVLVLAAIALNVPALPLARHTTVPAFISTGQYRQQLAPNEIVVVVSDVGNAGMLWQAESGFYMRVAGGFLNAGVSHRTDLPRPVQDLSHATPTRVATFEAFLRASKIGAIVLDARRAPAWAGIFAKIGLTGHQAGGVVVYQVNGCQACRSLDWAQLRGRKTDAA